MILEGSETGKGRHLGGYSMLRRALVKRAAEFLFGAAATISGNPRAPLETTVVRRFRRRRSSPLADAYRPQARRFSRRLSPAR